MTKRQPLTLTCEYEGCKGPMPTTGRRKRYCSQLCGDRAYRTANVTRLNEYARDWAAANPERSRTIKSASRVRHRVAYNAATRAAYADGRYDAAIAAWRASPEGRAIIRANTLWKRYRMTVEEYDAKAEAQNHCCALCGQPERIEGRRLAVDHDHSCCPGRNSCGACTRDLLCTVCNQRLGVLEDDEFVAAAQAYQARHAV